MIWLLVPITIWGLVFYLQNRLSIKLAEDRIKLAEDRNRLLKQLTNDAESSSYYSGIFK